MLGDSKYIENASKPVTAASSPVMAPLSLTSSAGNKSKSTAKRHLSPEKPVTQLPEVQAPLLSKKAKKAKTPKPARISKEDALPPSAPLSPTSTNLELPQSPSSAKHYLPSEPASLEATLDALRDDIDLESMSFFNVESINPKTQLPLRYAPLVHALSALSTNGHTFTANQSTGSIDSAVSSFQQLLETLTQTISDLLRLLPRDAWNDGSSFDGVLRDMLKTEDFMDEPIEEVQSKKDDEVVALTMALERRARWMEMQLAKLEELHRDINNAAVKTVLSINEKGWDRTGFLPKIGGGLARFEGIGKVKGDNGFMRAMSSEELEAALSAAKEQELAVEEELRGVIGVNTNYL